MYVYLHVIACAYNEEIDEYFILLLLLSGNANQVLLFLPFIVW